MKELDRLTPGDVSNLRVEDHGLPMHVAGLLILERSPLNNEHGAFSLDAVMTLVEARLYGAPRLRQVLSFPPIGLGRPLWVDDPRFDISNHVRVRPVPAPGDEEALLAVCAQLNRARLDRSRPLWDIWFLTGLPQDRVAMLIRLHHAVADGIATVGLLGSLFDLGPSPRPATHEPWAPHRPASRAELRADNIQRRRAALAKANSALLHPERWAQRVGSVIGAARQLLGEGMAPRSSLNARIGNRRRLLLARGDLDRAKAVGHAHGGKLNDVMLAAVAGGARELLLNRGELVPGSELRVSVPVSRRTSGDPARHGNRVGVMIVPLPVSEPDPIRRLEAIVHATAARKQAGGTAIGWDVGSPFVQRAVVWLMNHQRFVNLLLSNVPGPTVPLYFASARVLEAFQIGVIQGNVTLAVGALSYAGQFNFDIVADAAACPDAEVFTNGLQDALSELGAGASAV